jgi:sarcosine oxidase, subunit alpha
VLTSTIASMQMDQNGMLLTQRIGACLPLSARGSLPEQRLWHVRAQRIVLATGALERTIVFPDNDRPGIMLAGAARAYLRRHALAPRRGAVFTTNDDAYRTALAWHAAGVDVAAIVDVRPAGTSVWRARALAVGIPVHNESVVEGSAADAEGRLTSVRVRTRDSVVDIQVDCLAVSGGYEPNLNLHHQLRGATHYDARLHVAVATEPLPGQCIAGAARGTCSLAACLEEGSRAGHDVPPPASAIAPNARRHDDEPEDEPSPIWRVVAPDGDESRSFIDLHRDATVAGIARAVDAGVRHIEHVKRYTLVGTGVEQGRSGKLHSAALTAELTGRPRADVGTSGSRPPYEPITFALMAGRARGALYEPVRTTSLHRLHEAAGAIFEPAGQWLRPSRYARVGESRAQTIARECRAARSGVAIMDASTLGKIDVQGPDATWFLEQLYANDIGTIRVGMSRYSMARCSTMAWSCAPTSNATSSPHLLVTPPPWSIGWRSGCRPSGPADTSGSRPSPNNTRRSPSSAPCRACCCHASPRP